MDEHTIGLLQSSFAEVMTIRQQAAALFYERLLVLDPALKPLFHDADMRSQEMKLTAALAMVVGKLRQLEEVIPALETSRSSMSPMASKSVTTRPWARR